MNVPCLIAWGDGFGVVVRSDANGMLVAHPRLGWLELHRQVIADAPDGFEVILVDRTSATPNDKFNFGWFMPAIQRYRSTCCWCWGHPLWCNCSRWPTHC